MALERVSLSEKMEIFWWRGTPTVACISQATAPDYSSRRANTLVSGLNKPIGVGVNTCGEILVEVGRKIQRHDKKTGDLLGDYVTFGGGKVVRYIGVTSTNEVFAVVSK